MSLLTRLRRSVEHNGLSLRLDRTDKRQLLAVVEAAQKVEELLDSIWQSEYAPVKADWPAADALHEALARLTTDSTEASVK